MDTAAAIYTAILAANVFGTCAGSVPTQSCVPVNLSFTFSFHLTDSGWLAVCRVDPMTLKEWYDIKAPSIFQVRNPGKTLVTRTKGTSECVCVFAPPGRAYR